MSRLEVEALSIALCALAVVFAPPRAPSPARLAEPALLNISIPLDSGFPRAVRRSTVELEDALEACAAISHVSGPGRLIYLLSRSSGSDPAKLTLEDLTEGQLEACLSSFGANLWACPRIYSADGQAALIRAALGPSRQPADLRELEALLEDAKARIPGLRSAFITSRPELSHSDAAESIRRRFGLQAHSLRLEAPPGGFFEVHRLAALRLATAELRSKEAITSVTSAPQALDYARLQGRDATRSLSAKALRARVAPPLYGPAARCEAPSLSADGRRVAVVICGIDDTSSNEGRILERLAGLGLALPSAD